MRLFVAIYPPATALDHLAEYVQRLRLGRATAAGSRVGLTARPSWHVTLAFLGEVPDSGVPAAAAALDTGVARWRARSEPVPRLRLAGGGRFGRRRFTVLWVGLDGDRAGLRDVATEVQRALWEAELAIDDRKPFRPHLTIARPGDRLPVADLDADLSALAEYTGPEWPVASVMLVRSHLGPKPVYDPLVRIPLPPAPSAPIMS
ncbi:RNA 2',3'-cyclic phosphodiesterase [Natronosporangium hydrolyticum]|uniref:RNA 2',3'-cyclic phosphodiesterase n=1 Tax=Natronosporangium hydrolyticum TaxID=2811111 RepID=A0A895YG39_9ACTN|nr:RNA 2',3'-cyclic phosphodiesterase [Natronosporangium hydrolyticum]QSB14449.1 RNA 2',3'-cyclic phosphodiesterase [Natronosporangium hydrolyticum]